MTDLTKHEEAKKSGAVAGRLEQIVICEYSQGICGDGAAILKDGIAMNVEEIVTELNKLAVNSNRYKYIRENQVWHRYGDLADDDSHALVGCRFPYLANFESKPMLDYNIDKMIQAQSI